MAELCLCSAVPVPSQTLGNDAQNTEHSGQLSQLPGSFLPSPFSMRKASWSCLKLVCEHLKIWAWARWKTLPSLLATSRPQADERSCRLALPGSGGCRQWGWCLGCAPAHSVSSPVLQLSFRSSVPYGGESQSQLMIKGQGFWLCQQTEVTDCTVTVRVTWTCVPRPAPVGNSSLLGGLDVRGLLIFP